MSRHAAVADGTRSTTRGFRRPSRSARAADAALEGIGGGRLAGGLLVAALLLVAMHVLHFAVLVPFYPDASSSAWAWAALFIGTASGWSSLVLVRTRWVAPALMLVVAVVVLVLDLIGTQGALYLGVTPTAAPAVGALLMPVAVLRDHRFALAVAGALAAILAVDAIAQAGQAGLQAVVGVANAGSAILPVVLTTIAASGLRRIVRFELDLVLVQSTVGTSTRAVGMFASEELARLDDDAERLLADVGAGRVALPLSAERAATAGSLATRLRMRLMEGRSDTWLKHAVAESEFLADAVEVHDPDGLAGALAPGQRDALLLVLWLLVSDRTRAAAIPVSVRLGPSRPHDPMHPRRTAFPIAIAAHGVPRGRTDPSTWEAAGIVGPYESVVTDGVRTITIDCAVENRADTGDVGLVR
ncbi:hypothetical protein ARHIZOSPH14_02690 [Agromyces rhizosphaerae]|uniref:Uncharacterized protein n=1 Tax=Agromyces rhizosphaerae TaxID=88374 RepID=A0A9W6FPY9_9MICO|nr:hypothetical protein [Agromyces rhizosphaerae]GLI26027.1 hypothetical protein ARHIZOSPH14_02690 [Agromyces rhizosphaerae]